MCRQINKCLQDYKTVRTDIVMEGIEGGPLIAARFVADLLAFCSQDSLMLNWYTVMELGSISTH